MLTQETIEKMNAMKLVGLVAAFGTQLSSSEYDELSFEERVGLLVDAEWTDRERRKLSRRLKAAKLRYPASLENVNFQAPRGLNRQQILTLVLFFTLNREDFSFVIHLDRQPRTSRRRRRRRGQGRVAARVASEPWTPSSTPVPSWSGGRS